MRNQRNIEKTKKIAHVIVRQYVDDKISADKLATLYPVSAGFIKKLLKQHGVKLRTRSEMSTKLSKNESFFSIIDTEAKAYWLGFLYADGCVTRGRLLTVSLNVRDIDRLRALSQEIYGFDNVKVYEKDMICCQFDVNSQRIYDDLVRLGCHERKTSTLRFPTEDQVPSHLLPHFVRGFFDGDGCITSKKGPRGLARGSVSFVAPIAFCRGLSKWLKKEANMRLQICRFRHTDKVVQLSYHRCLDIVRFYNLVFENATIYMPRKRSRLIEYVKSHIEGKSTHHRSVAAWKQLGSNRHSFMPILPP